MTYYRYVPKAMAEAAAVPFDGAEAAWLWYCHCQVARIEGARVREIQGRLVARPCEPDDVFTIVDRLYRSGTLARRHLVVLGDYGSRLTRPHRDNPADRAAAHCWDEAMALLTPALKFKGIVV